MTGAGARSTRRSCSADLLSADRCSALRCCSGSTRSGSQLSWKTAVFAHLVWIVPVVTLVISIQVYRFDPALEEAAFDLGATRWQVLPRGDAAGALSGHLLRRAVRVPAVVGQFPVVALHDRRRHDGAGIPLCQDGRRLYAGRAGARHGLDHRRERHPVGRLCTDPDQGAQARACRRGHGQARARRRRSRTSS